ncbi:MAG: flagellar filament capping protein FliD [Selenomonadaceae bacterium]|nr:flagellar filament capping protein FliD [Selenomonadaceae bacterium]
MAYTVSSIANNTYSMFHFASKNGASLFGSSSSKKANDGISAMWNNYANSQNSSYGITAANVYGVKSSAREVLSSYEDAKKTFHAEYSSTMEDLSKAVKSVNSTDFHVGKDALAKTQVTTTDKDGKTNTTTKLDMSDELKTAMKNVKGLVDAYNGAIDLFQENAPLSNRMQNMSDMFSDTKYRASNYESIGISVGKDGALSINEEKLADAIVSSPDKVARIVGKEGLVAKAESHKQTADYQKDKLFPSASSMFGSELKTAQAYTGSGASRMNSYMNVGNLVSMYF